MTDKELEIFCGTVTDTALDAILELEIESGEGLQLTMDIATKLADGRTFTLTLKEGDKDGL